MVNGYLAELEVARILKGEVHFLAGAKDARSLKEGLGLCPFDS